jgi:magnesium chelatase subunit I
VADGRDRALPKDVQAVAPMALRLRRSAFMKDFFTSQSKEEKELARLLARVSRPAAKPARRPSRR